MPKHYRDLSHKQQNRRLCVYQSNDKPKEIHVELPPAKAQPVTATGCHFETLTLDLCVADDNFNAETEPSQYNLIDEHSQTTLEETVVDENDKHDAISESPPDRNIIQEVGLSDWLSRWAIQYNIRQNALTSLIQDLRNRGHPELPRDARTLLRTPRKSSPEYWASGSYFHYGLERALTDELNKNISRLHSENILIDLNIDGLPLSKSSKSQLWPILGKIYHKEFDHPFLIGAYHGTSKPRSVSEFLSAFVKEYETLHKDGILFRDKHYNIAIRAVICDAPARSYVTCTKAHNAYFGCSKCIEEGDWNQHRMLFLNSNARLRTDTSFRNREHEEHHTGSSPFGKIGVGMVSQFPIDPLHLFWLGVCKEFLSSLLHGYHTGRLSGRKIKELSERLVETSQWIPKEFARKPRGLDELKRWKATEFRIFGLYLGPVVLQDILPHATLMHFNTLHCAARILSHPLDCYANNDYAHDLLVHFVEVSKILYGEESVIYNVHNLVHIHEDVKKHGSLDNFSAWPFENFMQVLKNMLRKKDKPLHQLYNRLTESSSLDLNKDGEKHPAGPVLCKKMVKVLPLNCNDAHKLIQFKDFVLTDKKPDNCCMLKDKSIVLIEHIGHKNGVPVIIGNKFIKQEPLPVYPCDSTHLNIYVTSGLSELQIWYLTDIANKTLILPFQNHCL